MGGISSPARRRRTLSETSDFMTAQHTAGSIRKVALTSLAGASIEWYDFFLYGTAAALVFPTVFFPAGLPPLVGLLASFGTFAVGFLARPLGGIVFAHFGDRIGRKRALVAALIMMGVATALIGCLPSYAVMGPVAPVLLVLLRFVQGLAIGGQWGGVVLLITENAPAHRRGFYGSFAQVGVPAGIVLANLAFLLLSSNVGPEAFLGWGWRVLFLVSLALVGLGVYVQGTLEDTAEFLELQRHRRDRQGDDAGVRPQRSPVFEAMRAYPRQIVLAAGAFMAVQATFYILVAFVVAFGTNPAGLALPRTTMLSAVLIGAIVMIPALIAAAAFSDRFGRRGIFMTGAALLGLWAFALFPLIETRSFVWITVAISVGQVFIAMMYGPQAAFFSELFCTRLRYSAASLGYQCGAVLGGALAPLIATSILARTASTFGISVYIAATCLITLVSTALLSETASARARREAEVAPQY
jgi:MFS family permease